MSDSPVLWLITDITSVMGAHASLSGERPCVARLERWNLEQMFMPMCCGVWSPYSSQPAVKSERLGCCSKKLFVTVTAYRS